MKNPIVAANPDFEFTSDAEVAIFTRLDADAVGATRMDRPECGGVNPRNGEIYFKLTNNSNRTVDGEISADAANPRFYSGMRGTRQQLGNLNGHIIRLAEARPTDARFKWDIYLFASEAGADKAMVNLSNLSDANDLSSPDGLVFSPATGICWIQTDDGAYTDQTNCMLLAALPGKLGDGGKRTEQDHPPGRMGLSGFTVADALNVEIRKPQPFKYNSWILLSSQTLPIDTGT